MADYNIYLHSIESANGFNKTKAWDGSTSFETEAWTPTSKGTGSSGGSGSSGKGVNFTRAIGMLSNPDSIVGSAVSTVSKAIPYFAVASAVVALGIKVIDSLNDFAVLDTGDYSFAMEWGNFKTSVKNVFHPASLFINREKIRMQIRNENAKSHQNALLLGDSALNTYFNRGV